MPDYEPPSADWLRIAVAAVLHDFPERNSLELTVTPPPQPDGSSWWRLDVGVGHVGGLQLPDEPTGAEILAEIAHYLQDQVFDQHAETWGEPLPICPGHPHPPDPRIIDGEAVWVCPRDGRVLAPIGLLAAA